MARYAPRFCGGAVFLSNMVIPESRYMPRTFGGAILLSGVTPIPDTNVTLYTREGNATVNTREGNITVYER